MSIGYDKTAQDTTEADPQGRFARPDLSQDFTIKYYPGSPGAAYYICLVELVVGPDPTGAATITVYKPDGTAAPHTVPINLGNLDDVWRKAPSTIDDLPANGPCAVLCVSEKVLAKAGITPVPIAYSKHPFAFDLDGDELAFEALKELAQRHGHQVVEEMPATHKLRGLRPELFRR